MLRESRGFETALFALRGVSHLTFYLPDNIIYKVWVILWQYAGG